VSIVTENATFHTLLHPAGLKAAGYAQPETAHGQITQPEVTEATPVCIRGSGKLHPKLVAYLQVTNLFQHISCYLH